MLKNVLRSWILSLQDIGMAKTFIATHDLWPEGASMPQTDCIIALRSKYHPATHQPQPFQTPQSCTAFWGDECGQRSIHCMIQTSPHCGACHGLIPISCNHSVYHECRSQRLAISASYYICHIVPTCHCLYITPQTWPSCHWDVLLAISCAWAPCTPTSLPCSRKWVNTLLIRNAEAKAWTAWMTARASTSEPLVARTLIMKESRMRTGPFGLHGSSSFHDVQSTKSSASSETKQWSRHTENQMKIDPSSRYSIKYLSFWDLHYMKIWYVDMIHWYVSSTWHTGLKWCVDIVPGARIWFLALHEALGMVNAKWGWLKNEDFFVSSIFCSDNCVLNIMTSIL